MTESPSTSMDNYANYVFDDEEEEDMLARFQTVDPADFSYLPPADVADSPAPPPTQKEPRLTEPASTSSKSTVDPSSEIDLRNFTRPRVGTMASGLYDVVSQDFVRQLMEQIIEEVSGIIQLPTASAHLLLSHFLWAKDHLIKRYFEDSDRIFRDAHVTDPSADAVMLLPSKYCDICYLDIDGSDRKQASCGHAFCHSCWRDYLEEKIIKENAFSKISCPAHKCQTLLDEEFIMELLKDSLVCREKYQNGLVSDFILALQNMRFCVGRDCQKVIRLTSPSKEWISVTCTHCKETFCYLCSQPWHDPVLCLPLKKWLKEKQDATGNWIAANTRDCPNYHSAIEKNGGCNQMHCSKAACGVAFCWLCLKVNVAYQPHGCNNYVEKQDAGSCKAALERYLFYDTRYNAHEQSLRLEARLAEAVEARQAEMVDLGMTWIEVHFLEKSVETLQRCRQTLMYTYAFAYFLRKSILQEIFQQNQADLEQATAKLSGFLERKIVVKDVHELKRSILDSLAYCEKRREILVLHVHEGYEKELWTFTV